MSRKSYVSDLSNSLRDAGRTRMGTTRTFAFHTSPIKGRNQTLIEPEVVNGIFYILYSGCHWRSLPHDLPPRQTVSTLRYANGNDMVFGRK